MLFVVSQFAQLWRETKGNHFVWAGHGEFEFADGLTRYLIAKRVDSEEFSAVWLPEGMSAPPEKFSLTHSGRKLRVHVYAPEGKAVCPEGLVVGCPDGTNRTWCKSLVYELVRAGDKEIAVLEKIDGQEV